MKNPRRIMLSEHFKTTHQLCTDPPPADSLFWKLWYSSKPIAEKALDTDFLKNLKTGTLDPIKFGAFNVSDAYYCFKGTDCYERALKRADDPTLKEFLVYKVQNYVDYNERFHSTWYIKDANSILPPQVCLDYSEFESNVSTHEEAIYTLILMLPCEYLWAWASKKLLPVSPYNLYGSWIQANDYPDVAYAMGNFIHQYQQANPDKINEDKALNIYQKAMEYEYLYFQSATQ